MAAPIDVDSLTDAELKARLVEALRENAELKQVLQGLRDEIARLKGVKGRPQLKPSGMEQASSAKPPAPTDTPSKGRGKAQFVVTEIEVLKVQVPDGSQFKGYEKYIVQDLVMRPRVVVYRRERWLTGDGRTILAPLPAGIRGHFGPELRRLLLVLCHEAQVTLGRLVKLARAFGLMISKRQLQRLLTAGHDDFLSESREILRAGLSSAAWVSADDTGARHQVRNAVCTRIGNDHFTWFGTTFSKSRLNFLELLRAGHEDYVINEQAVAYMRARALSGPAIAKLVAHPQTQFANAAAWQAHLKRLRITARPGKFDPVCIATEGALWGSIAAHGYLGEAAIISDDAGQFNVGTHGLCWVHAERLVHALHAVTDEQHAAQQEARRLIWDFYRDLKTYCATPVPERRAELGARFDSIFTRRTNFATLDRLLARLHANKSELLLALDRPEVPLHTNAAENDIRCQVTRRKVSGGTRSDSGRDCRDAFLSLAKTCAKLGIAFWDYLGNRLAVPNSPPVPYLPALVRHRCETA